MYTFRQKLAMGWGKIRRSLLIAFRKGKVEKMLERRRGACSRCGACCKLLFNCPAYDDSDGSPKCLVYNDRPGVCGLFPLDERDLRERDFVSPDRACGFRFEDAPAAEPQPVRVSMPLRWGPGKRSPGDPPDPAGKPGWMKGAWAIIWAYFNLKKPKKPDAGPTANGSGNGAPV
jgi:hypothetical protein